MEAFSARDSDVSSAYILMMLDPARWKTRKSLVRRVKNESEQDLSLRHIGSTWITNRAMLRKSDALFPVLYVIYM